MPISRFLYISRIVSFLLNCEVFLAFNELTYLVGSDWQITSVAHASDFLSLKLPNCGLVLYALEGLECQG